MTTTEQTTTPTSPIVRRRRLLRRSAYAIVTALAAALAVMTGAAPAHAATSDVILIDTDKVDFAWLIDPLTHEPTNVGGLLSWNAGGGNYTPRLLGTLSSHATTFNRVRIEVVAHNASGGLLASGSSPELVGDEDWDITGVDLSLTPIATNVLDHVHVIAYLWVGNGWVEQSSIRESP
jgi:hypothetical protein